MPTSNPTILIPGLDPTLQPKLTSGQLAQLITGAQFASGIGGIVVTTDSAGIPVLPDAVNIPAYQEFVWLRVSPTTTSVSAFLWNPNATYILSYTGGNVVTNWTPIATGSIPAGSITGTQIASNTIQPGNINLTALLTALGLTPSSYLTTATNPAAGDISGSFGAGFTIGNSAVTGAKIASDGVNGIGNANINPKIINVSRILGGTIGQVPQVADNANTVGWVASTALGRILQIVNIDNSNLTNSSGNLANSTATPSHNSTGMTDAFNSGAFTKLDTTGASKLLIECFVQVFVGTANNTPVYVGLYNATGSVAPLAGAALWPNPAGVTASHLANVYISYLTAANPTNATYYIAFGCTSGSARVNSVDGTTVPFGGGIKSTIRITEYI